MGVPEGVGEESCVVSGRPLADLEDLPAVQELGSRAEEGESGRPLLVLADGGDETNWVWTCRRDAVSITRLGLADCTCGDA